MEACKNQNSKGGKHYPLLVEPWHQEVGGKPDCLFLSLSDCLLICPRCCTILKVVGFFYAILEIEQQATGIDHLLGDNA